MTPDAGEQGLLIKRLEFQIKTNNSLGQSRLMIHRDKSKLEIFYSILYNAFGPQSWWPGETRTEIIIGAVLTQNTAWTNVEKAISFLKKHCLLDFRKIYAINNNVLAEYIRPAGYYNVKAARLKCFAAWLENEYQGDLAALEERPTDELRNELLSIHGIGNETADSILLYAFNRPVFVIDAYTKRMLTRHRIITAGVQYHTMQNLFHHSLENDAGIFNEYHALIVKTGKLYCKTKPLCDNCPLKYDL